MSKMTHEQAIELAAWFLRHCRGTVDPIVKLVIGDPNKELVVTLRDWADALEAEE